MSNFSRISRNDFEWLALAFSWKTNTRVQTKYISINICTYTYKGGKGLSFVFFFSFLFFSFLWHFHCCSVYFRYVPISYLNIFLTHFFACCIFVIFCLLSICRSGRKTASNFYSHSLLVDAQMSERASVCVRRVWMNCN